MSDRIEEIRENNRAGRIPLGYISDTEYLLSELSRLKKENEEMRKDLSKYRDEWKKSINDSLKNRY